MNDDNPDLTFDAGSADSELATAPGQQDHLGTRVYGRPHGEEMDGGSSQFLHLWLPT